MASYVVKVQFEDSVRRLPLASSFSYEQLVSQTRELFRFPADAQVVLTYVDRDGDVITMAGDGDLQDALVLQSLNPLRVKVTILGTGKLGLNRESPADKDVQPQSSHNEQKQNPLVKTDGKETSVGPAVTPAGPSSNEAPDVKAELNEQAVHYGITCDDCGTRNIRGTRYKSLKKEDYDLCGVCFEKPGVDAKDYIVLKKGRPDRRFIQFNGRFAGCDTKNSNIGVHRRGFEHPMHRRGRTGCAGGMCENGKFTGGSATDVKKQTPTATTGGEVFHYGVTCDECKACPIVGPRFKSNKKYNYDLCHGCLQKIDGPASDEYTRIENPVPQLYPHVLLKKFYSVSPTYSAFPFGTYGRPRSPRQVFIAAVIPQKVQSEANPQRPAKGPEAAPEGATERDGVSSETNVQATEWKGATGSEEKVMPNVAQKEAETMVNTNQIPENNEAQNASHSTADFDGLESKLASMGFTDKKLNEELLRKNNFDLRSTLDDLCTADDWDPILEELQEMGFYDTDLNRQLLFQNNGSMQRVIKELVGSEKVGQNKVSKGEKQE